MPTHEIELPADVASCSGAPLREEALAQATEELRSNASLLVSEVVANAVLHAGGPLTVEVLQKGSAYRIAVSDEARCHRPTRAMGRTMPPVGVCNSWSVLRPDGVARTGTGKVVWFDLPVPFDDASPRGTQRRSHDNPYPNGTQSPSSGRPSKR